MLNPMPDDTLELFGTSNRANVIVQSNSTLQIDGNLRLNNWSDIEGGGTVILNGSLNPERS